MKEAIRAGKAVLVTHGPGGELLDRQRVDLTDRGSPGVRP